MTPRHHTATRLTARVLVWSSLLHLAACGAPEPVEEAVSTPASDDAIAASMPQQPQVPGFGPVKVRLMGTDPKPGAGEVYAGDCDDMRPLDDDFEVMTFSAPWKIVGQDQSGAGAKFGGGVARAFVFEKNPDATRVRLILEFRNERSDLTAADLTQGMPRVADLEFGSDSVGLYRVQEAHNLQRGYAAIFPIVRIEGMPSEPGLTGNKLATVQLVSVGLPEFDGWSEAEIIALFDSFYSARCLGEGLEQAFAALSAEVTYE